MTKKDTQVSVFMGTTDDVDNCLLKDEVEHENYHFKFYMPKPNPGETTEDAKRRVDNQINFLFSKSFLQVFLEKKMVSQTEYDKCLKKLEIFYLTES